VGFEAPLWRCLDLDPAEEGVEGQPRVRCQFGLAKVEFDATEPREHRPAGERLGSILERDAVENGNETELVALLVAERGDCSPHVGSSGHHPRPGAELDEE
jgi:hypothetical protein